MRAHEMNELVGAILSLVMILLTRRRPAPRWGEQTGGGRCAAMRLSERERARRGLSLPSEGPAHGRSPPELS